jgi:hypothetical protein
MSPLSVAQFLNNPPIHFDLVVFDEASQIFTEDAIGAVMRGNQLVVAGDEKQLPPTSFFQASQVDDSDGDEEEDDSTEQPDYESVLAACSTVLRQKMLRWHYRRRHEGLIAFSNARLFESRLVTFPSANDAESEMGVRWVPVPNGVYDRGKSRTNAREARRIAELVVEHWKNRPEESLGVVTLSQAQMDRVDDVLQERIRKEPDLEDFYMQEGDERFFVKNLENVQGDERDHIILGIGYGKDARGILTSGWSPEPRRRGAPSDRRDHPREAAADGRRELPVLRAAGGRHLPARGPAAPEVPRVRRARAGRPGDLERRLRRSGLAPRGDCRGLPQGEGVRRRAAGRLQRLPGRHGRSRPSAPWSVRPGSRVRRSDVPLGRDRARPRPAPAVGA